MIRPQPNTSYASVVPSRKRREEPRGQTAGQILRFDSQTSSANPKTEVSTESVLQIVPAKTLKRGHSFSYAALFAFTAVLYARPSDFYPSASTNSMALVIALVMLAFFIPTQLSLEGNLTAMLPEVRLVLLYGLLGLVGIPLAISRPDAWQEFSGVFIR